MVYLQHLLAEVEQAADREVEFVRVGGVIGQCQLVEDVIQVLLRHRADGGDLVASRRAGAAGVEGRANRAREGPCTLSLRWDFSGSRAVVCDRPAKLF